MSSKQKVSQYERLVEKKFNLYNALFLSLPFKNIQHTGNLLPLLYQVCLDGYEEGKNPKEIIQHFFHTHTNSDNEQEQIDFLFRVIQYVERQVVLFDSIEDATFSKLNKLSDNFSIREFLNILKAEGEQDKVFDKLQDFSVRIVLTAHPTQFYPLDVLNIILNLRSFITDNNIESSDLVLQQLALTSLLNTEKPTPIEEAKNIIHYLRYTYYDAIGEFYSKLKKDFTSFGELKNPNLIKLGFWPGGDRDGNPFVTAEVTNNVASELRMTLMKCYYKDVKELERHLTFRLVKEDLLQLKDRVYESMFSKDQILNHEEILAYLYNIRKNITEHYNDLYLDELDKLIDKVNIFKSHFASIDIRQDHSVHLACINAIIAKNNWSAKTFEEMTFEEQVKILNMDTRLLPEQFSEPLVIDTIRNIRQLKSIQDSNGEDGCHRYIISNSVDIYSVLFVYKLFVWCGWKDEDISFDIIPLFETMEGMQNAEQTMQYLYTDKSYSAHLNRRNKTQTIMLGFSDGTKDGGYLKANWSIYQTKEVLSAVSAEHNIKAIFFDGRGGPPARGGGKTHRFYASNGKSIANNEIQLTVQGQTITSTFGTKDKFKYNCEQLVTAGLSNDFLNIENADIGGEFRSLLDEMANISFTKYDALKQHPQFIPYLEQMSTLKYYSNAKIGSRPGKRGNKKQLELSDLRAISFVGSWSQLKQNVPGYYGIGTAIKTIKDQGRIDAVKELFEKVPFFKALMLNSMMSLTKTYFPLTAYMKENEKFGSFWNLLHEEMQLSKDMLLEISGYQELMQEELVSKKSVKIREKIVLPLLTIQQYALQKIAEGNSLEETYKKLVTRSLYGNINASRNSA
jgi:phosphoenolpyruvate carboxylase